MNIDEIMDELNELRHSEEELSNDNHAYYKLFKFLIRHCNEVIRLYSEKEISKHKSYKAGFENGYNLAYQHALDGVLNILKKK